MCKSYRWSLNLGWADDRDFDTLAECRKAARDFLANAPVGRSCQADTLFGTPRRACYPGTKTHVFEREAKRVVEWSYDANWPRS